MHASWPTGTAHSVHPPSPRSLSSNFIRGIPRLTAALVRKYPPLSLATSFGHLDTLRQGIASTRKLPSPSALASTPSRRDRRRSLFLDDFDDQDEERSEELSLLFQSFRPLPVDLLGLPSPPPITVRSALSIDRNGQRLT